MEVIFELFFWNWLFFASGATVDEGCKSLQYLELGKKGTIQCSFEKGFYGVVWYNSTDIVQDPTLVMKDSVKSGAGYSSGEYDVHFNGSLLINHVLIKHEGNFAVLKFHSNVGDPDLYVVRVETFVEPVFPYPLVAGCPYTSDICFQPTNPNAELNCSLLKTRPAVRLMWVERTLFGDKNISSTANVTSDGVVYSSYISTRNVFHSSENFALLVCKADGPMEVIKQTEKQVLLLNENIDISSIAPQLLRFQRDTEIELKCEEGSNNFSFIVWVRLRDGTREYLIYSIFVGGHIGRSYRNDILIGKNNSLHVSQAKISQEGIYYCILGDGVTNGIIAYDVSVYVNPLPPYPVIDGCDEGQYCVLEKETRDNISCSLNGIRPHVSLMWKVLHGDMHSSVSFDNDQLLVEENGDTFNVKFSSAIHFTSGLSNRLTVECTTSGPNAFLFDLSTKFDLLFLNVHPTEEQNIRMQTYVIVIVVLIAVVFVFIIVVGISRIKVYLERSQVSVHSTSGNGEEVIPMKPDLTKDTKKEVADESNDDSSTVGIDKVNEKYTLPEHLPIRQSSAKEELRILVLGKIGVGKSATANSILGENVFFEDFNTMPTTLRATCATRNVNGRKISVIDTAGLDDPNRRTEDICEDVARIMMIFSNGVHVLLYVLNAASPRFNEKDLESIKDFENILGGNLKSYRVLVYSHADSIKQEMDLNAYWNEQQKGGETISCFFEDFGRNVVAVNNSTRSLAERERNQTAIVALIDLLREQNKNSVYMHDGFTKAATEKENLQQKTKSMKWNPDIVETVEKIWAGNPEIKPCSKEFVDMVMLQIAEHRLLVSRERRRYGVASQIRTKDSIRTINKTKGTVLEICAEYEKILRTIKGIAV